MKTIYELEVEVMNEFRKLEEETVFNKDFREARKKGKGVEFLKNCEAIKQAKYHTLEITDSDNVAFVLKITEEAEKIIQQAKALRKKEYEMFLR